MKERNARHPNSSLQIINIGGEISKMKDNYRKLLNLKCFYSMIHDLFYENMW